MKSLIAVTFVAAGCGALLSHFGGLSATSLIPPILFAFALVLALLHLINASDRRF